MGNGFAMVHIFPPSVIMSGSRDGQGGWTRQDSDANPCGMSAPSGGTETGTEADKQASVCAIGTLNQWLAG
jgi:hypothetical protein